MFGSAEFLDAVRADVMICEKQAVCGNEGARSTVIEAHRGKLQVAQKIVRNLEAVLLFHLFPGEAIQEPHAFVGEPANRGGEQG